VTAIEHGKTSVTVNYREYGGAKKMEADYLVSCIAGPTAQDPSDARLA
jgi:hypothetical protein